MQRLLRDAGFESDLFTARDVRAINRSTDAWLLYHCSTGSDLADVVLARDEPFILDYHNITPPELFASWDGPRAHAAAVGRRQLAQLAPRAHFGIADSCFNERELRALGCERTAVVPLLIDPGRLGGDGT